MNNAPNPETDPVNIDKIRDLFLNKIEGLNWYYFKLDFNLHLGPDLKILPADHEKFNEFLAKIELSAVTGRYVYTGPPADVKVIFPLLLAFIKDNPKIIESVTKRIFDIKDHEILDESDAMQGMMGKYNKSDLEHRNKVYAERVKSFIRDDSHFVVLAEGDSWFEFPKVYAGVRFLGKDLIKDIVDWMIEDENYNVYSLAAGGDWLSNMMYMGEYIPELPKVSPDVFLISGGGNDMVGNHRLATMVVNPLLHGKRNLPDCPHLQFLMTKRYSGNPPHIDKAMYERGLLLIADDFYNFLNICMAQYFLFFYNLNSSEEYKNMMFITQGYDYPIPSDERHKTIFNLQHWENAILNSGKWLFEALMMKGISDPADQRAVLYTCIYEFNEMLISLSTYDKFNNVFHIDNRGVADTDDAWYDELHLKSPYFEKIAEAYKKCIRDNARKVADNQPPKKVYRTANGEPGY